MISACTLTSAFASILQDVYALCVFGTLECFCYLTALVTVQTASVCMPSAEFIQIWDFNLCPH